MDNTARIYLDHAGATLASEAQIKEISENLMKDVFRLGNPHSRHQSGETTSNIIKQVKECILSHFGVTSEEYAVIFTKNTSDSLKLVAEIVSNFDEKKENNKKLLLCSDSHTSVHGIRHQLKNWNTEIKSFETLINANINPYDLFIFTAMSNFTGKKYDKNIILKLKEKNPNILICIDLASLCGTSPINLKDFHNPDFVALSFYKIFGYPTGIGALLINRKSGNLNKFGPKGFFGGSVNFYNVETGDFILKENFEEKFEIGTPNYHGIDLLRYGFKDLQRFGGMEEIQKHTFKLAKMAFKFLTETKHSNNFPIAIVYGWDSDSMKDQGPIVTFNLKRDDGSFVGYVEVEKMCSLFGIELRTGCFCNQGACNEYLELKTQNNNQHMIKKCGDEMDILNGKPLGACRISFGRTSTLKDFEVFKTMIETCFISTTKLFTKLNLSFNSFNDKKKKVGKLTDLFFYPIKSCAAAKLKRWRLTKSGLWLDRQWIIVSGDGIVLTQKKLPALCNIIPTVTENNTLQLSDRFGYQNPIELPLIPQKPETAKLTTVCISNYLAFPCGKNVSKWLTTLHPTFPETSEILRLLPETCDDSLITEISHSNQNSTFTNEADYLLITWASVKAISKAVNLEAKEVAKRFRPNFIVETFTDIPFDEDNFSKIYIGGIPFEVTGKCTRCQMISIDQETGEKDPKVLLALRDARCGDKITFGVYLKRLTENEVDISVGSTVIIERNHY